MAEEGYKVTLNVYDLSQGLARQLSTTFLGKAIDGIWHTGVVVYGNEYFFGGGIQHTPAGATPYGRPIRVVDLGVTHVPKDVFEIYLEEINHRYSAETYNLLHHNCNNFSSEVAQFLVGSTIPDYILQLPNEVMNSPMGALIMPMIQNLETTLRSGAVPQAPQFNPTTPAQAPWASANTANINLNNISATPVPARETNGKASVDKVKSEEESSAKPQQVANAKSPVKKYATRDSLGNARAKVQDEIAKEFATIMAAGTLRASEAAALATRRVMQRYGQLEGTMSQC